MEEIADNRAHIPCDVILVAKDGTEIKTHRNVLSQASSFFEKLLESGMKESIEGVISLETLTGVVLLEVVEFMYNGRLQIFSLERAKELIEAAEYLDLPSLKTAPERFLKKTVTSSNCFSIYYFAEMYRCGKLLASARRFIFSNFATVANSKEFLSLSSQEVEMWISSDEIQVVTEDDVFKIIMKWIAHDKSEREKNFDALFCHVRLVFVTRHTLEDFVTDNLVKRNEGNLNMQKALKRIGPWKPRKPASHIPVIVTCGGNETFCYLPHEAAWYRLAPYEYNDGVPRISPAPARFIFSAVPKPLRRREGEEGVPLPPPSLPGRFPGKIGPGNEVVPSILDRACLQASQLVAFQGKIYNFNLKLFSSGVACYDPVSESWTKLRLPRNLIPNMVTVLGDNIYGVRGGSHFVSKYDLSSNAWDRIPLSDGYINEGACMVGHDNWLYFIGGFQVSQPASASSVVKGFNVHEIKWKRLANMQQERYSAFAAAGPGKVYIAGGKQSADEPLQSCEVYDVATNMWQSIASLNGPRSDASMVCYPLGALYVLGGVSKEGLPRALTVECYDPETNTWGDIATIPHIVADNPGTSHAENRVTIRQGFQIDCTRSGQGLSGSDNPDSCIFQACLLNLSKGVLARFLQLNEEGSDLHRGMSLLMPKPIN